MRKKGPTHSAVLLPCRPFWKNILHKELMDPRERPQDPSIPPAPCDRGGRPPGVEPTWAQACLPQRHGAAPPPPQPRAVSVQQQAGWWGYSSSDPVDARGPHGLMAESTTLHALFFWMISQQYVKEEMRNRYHRRSRKTEVILATELFTG